MSPPTMEVKKIIRLLIGGSPCTHWSIAQSKNRETTAEGLGWELFKNYLIAKEKYKPDFFLYENNKSAAQPIKDQISYELGMPLQYINSSLVSAQNRQRFYCHNIPNVSPPQDKGILLKDIVETGEVWLNKSYALTTRCNGAIPEDTLNRHRHTMVAEPVAIGYRNRREEDGLLHRRFETSLNNKSNALTTVQSDSMIAEPLLLNATVDGKAQCLRATCYKDGIRNLVGNNVDKRTCVAERIPSQVLNVNPSGKGMNGAVIHTECKSRCLTTNKGEGQKIIEPVIFNVPHGFNVGGIKYEKSPTITANGSWQCNNFLVEWWDGKTYPVYEVLNGTIEIKGKTYSIKLPDGYYIIRKLTIIECKRLQTVPDNYLTPCSASQNYKMLGNGWTVDVIAHILSHIPNIQNEEIEVLSMYDGMSCGHIALDKLGTNVKKYYATEIDKYALQTTLANYPQTIQLGDAFQVRENNWVIH